MIVRTAVIAIVALTGLSCAGDTGEEVSTATTVQDTPAFQELDRSSFVRLPVPDLVRPRFPPMAALAGDRALLVAYVEGSTYGEIGAAGILLPDKTVRPTDPLPALRSTQPVGLSDGFAIAGTTCQEAASHECIRYLTVVVFLDQEGRVTATQAVAESDSPGPEAVADGNEVVVLADGYYRVSGQGAERLQLPGASSSVCPRWPGGLLALELTPADPAEPESGPLTVQAYELGDGKWKANAGSRRVVGDDDDAGLPVYPRCVPGGVQSGPSFWTPTSGWFSLDQEDLYLSPELALTTTAGGAVVLATPPGPQVVNPNGKVAPLPSRDGDPIVRPPLAKAFKVVLDQAGTGGLLLSAPAPSVDLAVQFLDVG